MRLPIAESMESLIFTRAGANINKVSLASSECVCVCVCVCVYTKFRDRQTSAPPFVVH